jgi:hypothetical protein
LRDPIIIGDNFVILPDGRKSALDLAFQTFPELDDKFDVPNDDFREYVSFVYDRLATEMVRRWNEDLFHKRSCEFMDRLAESGDSLLEELLVICLLEKLAEDPEVVKDARACLGLKAAGFLRVVENEMFGR